MERGQWQSLIGKGRSVPRRRQSESIIPGVQNVHVALSAFFEVFLPRLKYSVWLFPCFWLWDIWWHSLTKARWLKFPQHGNAVYASITCTCSLVVSRPLHFQEVIVCKRYWNEVGTSRPSENLFCWKSEGLRLISSPAQSPSHWMRHFQRSPPNPKISIFPR